MADPSKANLADEEAEPDISPERLAAIRAAMMEELGNARKDTLPLEDKKGSAVQVDLQALDKSKKANDRRTREFQVAQRHADATRAWNDFQDPVDPADQDLDDMNSGQSHRPGMQARMEAIDSSSRGRGTISHARRGEISGRGGHSAARGANYDNTGRTRGANHAPSNTIGGSTRAEARGQPTPRGSTRVEVRGQPTPRGNLPSVRRGPTRGGSPASPRQLGVADTPRAALSFANSQSVNALSIDRGTARLDSSGSRTGGSVPSRARSPVKSEPFRLATPEQFLNHFEPAKSISAPVSTDTTAMLHETETALQPVEDHTATQSLLGTPDEERSPDAIGFTNPGPLIQTSEAPSGAINNIMHKTGAKVRVLPGKLTDDVKTGDMLIVTNTIPGESRYILQFEAQGKIYLEQLLGESFEYTIDEQTLSFNSSFMGQSCRWVVEPHLHWMLLKLKADIERCKAQPPLPHVSTPTIETRISYVESTENLEELEDLISFSDNELPGSIVSSWAQDLLCLMHEQTSEEATQLVDNQITQPPFIRHSEANEVSKGPEKHTPATIEATKPGILQPTLRGLASSRYAAAEIMDKYLNENPPRLGSQAADISFNTELIRRATESSKYSSSSENANPVHPLTCIGGEDGAHEQELHEQSHRLEQPLIQKQNPAQQQPYSRNPPRVQYTIEDMKKCRPNACVVTKPLMEEWTEQPQRGRRNPAESASASGVALAKSKNSDVPQVPARNSINISRQGIRIIAGTERPDTSQGLASSRYAPSSPPKIGRSTSVSSNSQNTFAKAVEIGNAGTQLDMNKRVDRNISKSVELPTSPSTLQSAKAGICSTNGPKPLSATEDGVSTLTSLRAAQNLDQDGDWKAEAQLQQGHYLALGNLNNLRKRDSYTSLASKDSDATVKLSKTGPDFEGLPQPHDTTPHSHASHLSIESTTSSASFATASEGKVCREDEPIKRSSTKIQGLSFNQSMPDAETSLNHSFEFPSEHMVGLGRAGSTVPMKASYSDDMFESNNTSTAFTTKQASSGQKIPEASQASRMPTASGDMSLLKAKGGLASSAFASTASTPSSALSNIENGSRTRPVGTSFPMMDQVAFGSYGTYALNAPANSIGQPRNHNNFLQPPIVFAARMDPMVATVVIDDPRIPGGLLEVTGHLKVGDNGASPLVAHRPLPTSQFPVYAGMFNENHGPRYASNGPFSGPAPVATIARTPLSPRHGMHTDSTADVQQELQLRLQRSLASPRSSASPP